MPRLLFPDFLADPVAYAKAQSHWRSVWDGVYGNAEVEQAWTTPWMTNRCMDGNPIFTAVCRTLHRGVRIIQEERCEPGDVDLDWWLDYYGDKREPDAVHELVIACCPSDENAGKIRQLLKQWIKRGKLTLRRPTTAS